VLDNAITLQLKDAAQLALKKMPSAEQEAISQVRLILNFICHVMRYIVNEP